MDQVANLGWIKSDSENENVDQVQKYFREPSGFGNWLDMRTEEKRGHTPLALLLNTTAKERV